MVAFIIFISLYLILFETLLSIRSHPGVLTRHKSGLIGFLDLYYQLKVNTCDQSTCYNSLNGFKIIFKDKLMKTDPKRLILVQLWSSCAKHLTMSRTLRITWITDVKSDKSIPNCCTCRRLGTEASMKKIAVFANQPLKALCRTENLRIQV